jgi:hypothetical protein
MSLRARFLSLLHHLLRVPAPAPVVQWRVPLRSWWWFMPAMPYVPPQEQEFTITFRQSPTLQ